MYWIAFQAFLIFIILLITAFVARFSRFLIGKLLRYRAPAISLHTQQYMFWFIWFIGIVFAVSQTGFSINVILIVTALIGLAIIISTRDITKNAFVRMALDLYPLYRMGDMLRVGRHSGKVIDINFLTTTLLSEDNSLVYIPNYLFLRRTTVNLSSSASHEVTIPILIDSSIDIMEFERNLLYLCKEYKKEFMRGTKPTIVTTRTTDDLHELNLLLSLENPEKKSVIVSELKEKIKRLIDDMS